MENITRAAFDAQYGLFKVGSHFTDCTSRKMLSLLVKNLLETKTPGHMNDRDIAEC